MSWRKSPNPVDTETVSVSYEEPKRRAGRRKFPLSSVLLPILLITSIFSITYLFSFVSLNIMLFFIKYEIFCIKKMKRLTFHFIFEILFFLIILLLEINRIVCSYYPSLLGAIGHQLWNDYRLYIQ